MRAILLSAIILAGCAYGAPATGAEETQVRADTPAGDHRGVTGSVERLTLETSLVSEREIEVWLPASYAAQTNQRYPVLYMHDGQNLFDPDQSEYSGWDWGVDEAMTAMGLEAIVVGIHSNSETRGSDYLPQKAALAKPDAFLEDIGEMKPEYLNADAYLQYLVEEVKPHIDARYRTRPGREDTTVMGSSMGGLISLYAVTEYPEVFGAAGMLSTHFTFGRGALIPWFEGRLPDPATHRLYFDFGTETLDRGYEPYQDQMDALVEAAGYERGVNWTTRKFEGDDHSERAWRNRIHIPLAFLLNGDDTDGGERR
ncbi:MAG: alpha/beta hydrolase-fold protein [Litorimonas sp.]